ncbi:NUDIX hydrolase [Ignatzschineria sp. LJL83]
MFETLFQYLPKPNLQSYLPLQFHDEQIGWVYRENLPVLRYFPQLFLIEQERVIFTAYFLQSSFESRNELLAEFSLFLKKNSIVQNWRDEAYGIYYPSSDLQNALFTIERGVAPFLGFRVFGVHINGYQYSQEKKSIGKLWIAKRSKLKFIEPHKLDNLAAGGLSYGENPLETAKREAMEEAKVPKNLTENLHFISHFNYLTEHENTIRNECIFMFDLPLPEEFTPVINDGEVEDFYHLSPKEVEIALLDGNRFKPNSGLVTLQFLLRKNLTSFNIAEKSFLRQKLGL